MASIIEARRAILLNTPHAETASGAVASFSTDFVAPLKSCVVDINPVQSGSNPSPSNICPISGWTGVNVQNGGDNLLPTFGTPTISGSGVTATINSDGSVTLSGTATSTVTIDAPVGTWQWDGVTPCWLSGCPSGGSSSKYSLRVQGETAGSYSNDDYGNGVALSEVYYGTLANKNIKFRIVVRKGQNVTGKTFRPMLNKGTSAKPYASYVSTTYPLTWQSTAGTVYGGNIDVLSGVLTVDTAKYVMDGTNNAVNLMSDSTAYKFFTKSNYIVRGYNTTVNNNPVTLWCDCYNAKGVGMLGNTFISGGYFRICADPSFTSVQDFNAYLGTHPITYIYKLATPLTYQLTPTQVKQLVGQNNIFADTGNVSLKYWTH